MSTSERYTVVVTPLAEKYYLKNFHKRYRKNFTTPWQAFLFMLGKFDLLTTRAGTNFITTDHDGGVAIYKCEFKVLPNESAKASGNRCIVARHQKDKTVKVLLVYSKNNIAGNSETAWWKGFVKDNYLEYSELLGGLTKKLA